MDMLQALKIKRLNILKFETLLEKHKLKIKSKLPDILHTIPLTNAVFSAYQEKHCSIISTVTNVARDCHDS